MGKDGKKQSIWCHLKDLLLLDSGSTCHTIMNSDLVKNIRRAKKPIDVSTNVGTKRINLESDMPGVGTTHFDAAGIANVLALGKLMLRYRVTMDSDIEDCFNVYFDKNGPPVKFHLTEDGLFAYKPNDSYLKMIADSKKMNPPPAVTSQPETQLVEVTKEEKPSRNVSWEDTKCDDNKCKDDATVLTEPETDFSSETDSEYGSEDEWSSDDEGDEEYAQFMPRNGREDHAHRRLCTIRGDCQGEYEALHSTTDCKCPPCSKVYGKLGSQYRQV